MVGRSEHSSRIFGLRVVACPFALLQQHLQLGLLTFDLDQILR